MPRNPTETKFNILHSARSLFSNYGFTAASLDDILSASGVTKGGFYHYFRGKDHLCEILLKEVVEEYKVLAETVDLSQPAEAQLKQWLTLLIDKNSSGQWVNCRFITRLSVQIQLLSPELQNHLLDYWQWYEGLYQQWLSGCGLSAENAKLSARTLIGTMFGIIWLDKCTSNCLSPADVISHQLRLILDR
jgi:TetR/AcrR family transcriptional repressor of nem operon